MQWIELVTHPVSFWMYVMHYCIVQYHACFLSDYQRSQIKEDTVEPSVLARAFNIERIK